MIKNILLIVLTILSLMFFAYAFIQKTEADKQTELAVTLKKVVEETKEEALKQGDKVIAAQAEADRQRAIAIENEKRALECEKGKKK